MVFNVAVGVDIPSSSNRGCDKIVVGM
jgi:hypothetical protein